MSTYISIVMAFLFAGIVNGYICEQIHIATGGDSSTMIISWITDSKDAASVVRYSTDRLGEEKDVVAVEGTSSSYTFRGYTSNQIHKVTLQGLKANTQYWYSVSGFDDEERLNFMTLPAPGEGKEDSIVYGVVGDLGQTIYSLSTIRHMERNGRIRGVLHAGDLSYANCVQRLWDSYGRAIQPVARKVPWMISVGNHEIEWTDGDSGQGLFKSVEARFPMPQVKPAVMGEITYPATKHRIAKSCTPSAFSTNYDYGIAYYSWETGLSHMIHLNCYSQVGANSEQYRWLESDLKKIDRSKTPWVFIVEHCPWYNSNEKHQNEEQTIAMKGSMEELIYRYDVNVVFAGHVHAYERSYPVFQDQVDGTKGVVYINIGDGGNKEGHSENYLSPPPEWSAFRNGTYFGHGEIEIHNSSALTWRWIRNVDHEAVSADRVTICNSYINQGTSTVYC